MKTKVLKLGMPIMAFLLAIVFAFATEHQAAMDDDSLVLGFVYNDDESDCVVTTKDCTISFGLPCTIGTKDIYRVKNGTQCLMPLYEWQ